MKPLPSTTSLLSYAWWAEHITKLVKATVKFDIEQAERAADQILEAGEIAANWKQTWQKITAL